MHTMEYDSRTYYDDDDDDDGLKSDTVMDAVYEVDSDAD